MTDLPSDLTQWLRSAHTVLDIMVGLIKRQDDFIEEMLKENMRLNALQDLLITKGILAVDELDQQLADMRKGFAFETEYNDEYSATQKQRKEVIRLLEEHLKHMASLIPKSDNKGK